MRILERLAILSAMALCVLAGEAAASSSISFDREFVYEEGQTIAQAYRTWRFDIDEAGVYALDIVPGTRPVTAFLDGAQIAFTRAGNDNKGKIDKVPDEYDEMVTVVEDLIGELKENNPGLWDNLIGIGISVPAVVDAHTGEIRLDLRQHGVEYLPRPLSEKVCRRKKSDQNPLVVL